MGEKDVWSNEFFKDNARFADITNAGVFQGRKVLQPEMLENAKTLENTVQKRKIIRKERDIIKKSMYGMNFVLIGVENQSDIHYAMPVRVMEYDYLTYEGQLKEIAKKHKREKDLEGAEFLSGFSKEDKLHPTFTTVLYYGEDPWDGPKSLWEMMDWETIPKEMREQVVDYPIHILDVRRFEGTEKLETDTRIVFGFMQRDKDKEELEKYIKENEQQFSNMDEDAYHMLSVMTNSKELIELMKRNKTKEGGANMCEALRQIKEECIIEGKKEGRKEGKIEGRKEGIQKGRIQGEKEGVAMSILSLLQMHGEVSEREKEHIFSQKDLETLTQWVRKAALTKDVESFMKEIS